MIFIIHRFRWVEELNEIIRDSGEWCHRDRSSLIWICKWTGLMRNEHSESSMRESVQWRSLTSPTNHSRTSVTKEIARKDMEPYVKPIQGIADEIHQYLFLKCLWKCLLGRWKYGNSHKHNQRFLHYNFALKLLVKIFWC